MVTENALSKHQSIVGELRHAYALAAAQLPPGGHIRLAKRTSNLFRFGANEPSSRLDGTRLNRVLAVDPEARTAEVEGMTTYEELVDATLPYGLMPPVVPQLKTITLGGAVTGLGIESSSFREGLPHESVREIEILTGAGEVVTASGERHVDLFRGFPNSYGTLGYALKLTIDLAPVQPFVRLQHVRYADAQACAEAIAEICQDRRYQGEHVDFIDGTVFAPNELYLTLGRLVADAPFISDYTGDRIYYQSIKRRRADYLTIRDYLWRWDTDWFWCSAAFGVQRPFVRRLWPKQFLRSDVYHRLVKLDRRLGFSQRLDRLRARPASEAVVQDVEVPVAELPRFLDAFSREIGITPAWLCPIQARDSSPLYPLKPGELYINIGFWSSVALSPGQPPDYHNRRVEELVAECGGHKSLYSTVHYSEEEFWQHYNGKVYQQLKQDYDPDGNLLDLYHKCIG